MHPAGSLIYFTVASGFGFGFLFFLGLGLPEVAGTRAFGSYFLGYGLAVTGLFASVLHLGNPINAWKAFSQWRSSWLSREAVVAVVTLLTFMPLALAQIFGGPDLAWLGYVGAALALVTVYCTSMIYGQLKTVLRWHQPLTPVLFLTYALAGGALLAQAQGIAEISAWGLITVQLGHWFWGRRRWRYTPSTPETATGLGQSEGEKGDGKVRLLERPHTGKAYLTTEMVHILGRKHANRLALISGLLLGTASLGTSFVSAPWLPILLIPLGLGALISRWLFFAEAEHVVSLYYGRR